MATGLQGCRAWRRCGKRHAHGLLDRQQQDHAATHAKFAQALAILERLGADHDAGRLRQAIAHTPQAKPARPDTMNPSQAEQEAPSKR